MYQSMKDGGSSNGYPLSSYGISFSSRERRSKFRKYEEFVFNCIFQDLTKLDFKPLPKYIDSNHVIAPKFSMTRGIRISRIPILQLANWLSPSIVLRHRTDLTLSIYYDGYPPLRSRLRPDISIVLGQIYVKIKRLSPFRETVNMYWRLELVDDFEKIQAYIPIVNDFGPEPLGKGKVINPRMIVDPTLGKPERRLKEQIKNYLKIFRPTAILILSNLNLPFAHVIESEFAREKVCIIDDFDTEKKNFQTKNRQVESFIQRNLKF